MQNMRQRSGIRGNAVIIVAATCCCLLSGCATDAWPVPEGTPPDIARDCRGQAALIGENSAGKLQERTGAEIAGAADDTMEDVREAKREDALPGRPRQEVFYQCLQENGVLFEPGDAG